MTDDARTLIGNLGADPEIRTIPSDSAASSGSGPGSRESPAHSAPSDSARSSIVTTW